MSIFADAAMVPMLIGIFCILLLSSLVTLILKFKLKSTEGKALVENLSARIKAWWVMIAVFLAATATGGAACLILFALTSFIALREYITLTPNCRADHGSLTWAFFVILPLNYILLAIHWYGLFVIFIPVYAFLWIPVRSALSGDSKDFLARTAKIQWGLMTCVYFVSYAPAILGLAIPGYETHTARLLCFLVFVVQISDVMQYVFGKLLGRHKVAPNISPNKTVEGLIGGVLSATILGALFYWITPFQPWQAAVMALLISLSGFGGGMVMSAIKRDRGVKDYGSLIPGHGGMMDRIDSLCFAAPLFYHLTKYFYVH